MVVRHERVRDACTALTAPCREKLEFHIHISFYNTVTQTCGNSFGATSTRIEAANSRIIMFAEQLKELAKEARDKAACVIQAVFRGSTARRLFAAQLAVKPPRLHGPDVDQFEEYDMEQEITTEAVDEDGEERLAQAQKTKKRPTRRGGQNRRLQAAKEARYLDTMSVPATDDGFE